MDNKEQLYASNGPLMYGDRVEFEFNSLDGTTNHITGLFKGNCQTAPDKALVTVTSDSAGTLNGTTVVINPENLTLIDKYSYESPEETCETVEDKSEPEYDKITLLQMRDKVLEEFEFDKVHRAMEALNWTWAPLGRVPTISELIDEVKHQIDSCIRDFVNGKDDCAYSTGGFETRIDLDPDDDMPIITVKFVVDSWEEFSSDYTDDYLERKENGGPVIPINRSNKSSKDELPQVITHHIF